SPTRSWARAFPSWNSAKRTISSESKRTNGSLHLQHSKPGGKYEIRNIGPIRKAAPYHVCDDRIDRGGWTKNQAGALRARPGRTRTESLRCDRHDGRSRQIHRPAYFRKGVS